MLTRRGFVFLTGAAAAAAAGAAAAVPVLTAPVPDRYERAEVTIAGVAGLSDNMRLIREALTDSGALWGRPEADLYTRRVNAGLIQLLADFPEEPEPWHVGALYQGLYPIEPTAREMRTLPPGLVPIYALRYLIKERGALILPRKHESLRAFSQRYRDLILAPHPENYPDLTALRERMKVPSV